jgi:hypothetical protein
MNATQEIIVRTYLKDTIQQNMKIVQKVFDTSRGSQEIRTKFIETPLSETTIPDLMKILDAAKTTESWNMISDRDPVHNELHNQVREIFISGSESFQDNSDRLLALKKASVSKNVARLNGKQFP